MKIQVINKSKFDLPEYKTPGSAGMDLRANIDESIVLEPESRFVIPTGIYIGLPVGYEMQVRSRSGLAAKFGIIVLNAPGTIDSDYRDEVGVVLFNSTHFPFTINPGDRIAQAVIAKYEKCEWDPVVELDTTERDGGWGSTGIS